MQQTPFDYAQLKKARRIIIKIGTNVMMPHLDKKADIIQNKDSTGNSSFISSIMSQIKQHSIEDKEFVLVSSGSIGFGAKELDVKAPIKDIVLRQVCASTGQPILMEEYRKAGKQFQLNCSQVLITRNDFKSLYSYTSIKNCIEALLKRGVLPVINENDTVSTEEIDDGFGDNDQLSALIASKLKADLLIILTDVDAYYTSNPRKDASAKRIPIVYDAKSLLKSTQLQDQNKDNETGTHYGKGGMLTKLKAAAITQQVGCILCIGYAFKKNVLSDFLSGEKVGTVFPAQS